MSKLLQIMLIIVEVMVLMVTMRKMKTPMEIMSMEVSLYCKVLRILKRIVTIRLEVVNI